MAAEYDYLFKLILAGPAASGKSCLLLRYVDNNFSEAYISTIGVDFKIRTIDVDNKKVKLQIWDTAGQERFRSITSSYYRGASGMMLVFDVTSTASFEETKKFFKELKEYQKPILLVGCMADKTTERKVTHSEATQRAQEYGATYIEASPKTGDNVNEAFMALVKEILRGAPPPAPVTKPVVANALMGAMAAMTVQAAPAQANEEQKESIETMKAERDALAKRVEAVKKIVKVLGAEGSLLVENINKVFAAPAGKTVEVDAEGNVKIIE